MSKVKKKSNIAPQYFPIKSNATLKIKRQKSCLMQKKILIFTGRGDYSRFSKLKKKSFSNFFMSESLYERFVEKYSFYEEIVDHIDNVKSHEPNVLVSFLLEKIEKNMIDTNMIYMLIAEYCDTHIAYIREYWDIFDKIYQHSKIKPRFLNEKRIINCLFAKKYNSKISCENWNDHKYDFVDSQNKCIIEEISLDEILNYYESNPIMRGIIHDDIKSFKDIVDSYPNFDFNQMIFKKSLIQNCCFCGAVECFKFLRSNGVKITKRCLDSSITSQNKTIINECLQYQTPNKRTMKKVLKTHNFEMALSFEQMYNCTIDIGLAAEIHNLQLFLYKMFQYQKYDSVILKSYHFIIPGLVEDILDLGANFDAKDNDGKSLLFYAARDGNAELVKLLVDRGANIDMKFKNSRTLLHLAAKYNNADVIAKLIERGASIDEKDEKSRTPLLLAAKYNSVEALMRLVELGANINMKENWKMRNIPLSKLKKFVAKRPTGNCVTPLSYAVSHNNIDAITFLVEHGANIEANYFEYAAKLKSFESLQKLLEIGVYIEKAEDNITTPLHWLARYNNVEFITKMFKLGANIEAKDKDGFTPLHYAAGNNIVDAITKLIELGANIDAKDKDGRTPLHYAAANNNVDAITKLIELGANIEAKNCYNRTPLLDATYYQQVEAVIKLIESGANIETKDEKNWTPIFYAKWFDNSTICQKLIESGANTQTQDINGKTPFTIEKCKYQNPFFF